MAIAAIRRATAQDASGIAYVHVRSWQVAYRGHMPNEFLDGLEQRTNMWRELTLQPDKILLVAETSEGTIVGFSALSPSRDADADPNTAEVAAIYVHPEKWRKGIGRALLSASLDQLRECAYDQITLWVLEGNQRARSFYESFGFTEDGAIKDDDHWKSFAVREVRYRLNLQVTSLRRLIMAESSSTFTRASAAYEHVMVPAVFGPWAKDLLDAAALAPGMRVLDVACGTGIVARLAALQVGPAGRVAGVDSNEAMLAVARAQPAPAGAQVEWRQSDATKLPFTDAEFDRVLCQHGLQYVADRIAALREMKRVLAAGSRLGLSVFSRSVGYQIFEETAAQFVGEKAATIMREPFALADLDELSGLLRTAEMPIVEMHTKTLPARFASAGDFIDYQLGGRLANAISMLSVETRTTLVTALSKAFEPYVGPEGLVFPMEAHVMIVRA